MIPSTEKIIGSCRLVCWFSFPAQSRGEGKEKVVPACVRRIMAVIAQPAPAIDQLASPNSATGRVHRSTGVATEEESLGRFSRALTPARFSYAGGAEICLTKAPRAARLCEGGGLDRRWVLGVRQGRFNYQLTPSIAPPVVLPATSPEPPRGRCGVCGQGVMVVAGSASTARAAGVVAGGGVPG